MCSGMAWPATRLFLLTVRLLESRATPKRGHLTMGGLQLFFQFRHPNLQAIDLGRLLTNDLRLLSYQLDQVIISRLPCRHSRHSSRTEECPIPHFLPRSIRATLNRYYASA